MRRRRRCMNCLLKQFCYDHQRLNCQLMKISRSLKELEKCLNQLPPEKKKRNCSEGDSEEK